MNRFRPRTLASQFLNLRNRPTSICFPRAIHRVPAGRQAGSPSYSVPPRVPVPPNLIAAPSLSVSLCSRRHAQEQDVLSQRGARQGRARQLHQGRQEEHEAERRGRGHPRRLEVSELARSAGLPGLFIAPKPRSQVIGS